MPQEIFFVIGSLERGGAERHLSYVLPGLKKAGWNVSIITLSVNNSLKSLFLEKDIKIFEPSYSFFSLKNKLPRFLWIVILIIYNFFRLSFLFSRHPKSILHFFLPEAYLLGFLAAIFSLHKGPTLMSRRSMNVYLKERPVFKWIEQKLHKRIFFILANSQKIIQELRDEEKVPIFKVGLIYNGIEDTSLLFHKNNKPDPTCLKISIVANLIFYKGHEDLFLALSLIKNKLPEKWILNIVGSDPQNRMSGLKKYAEELGIHKNILWSGEKSDIEALWSETDIGILCSHQEGFSNSILEAMRAGVPMVVTNVGGNSEAIIHQVCGLLVEAHKPHELGLAISELARDSVKRESFGEIARARFLNYFSIEKCLNRYELVYKEILKNSYPLRSENLEITL